MGNTKNQGEETRDHTISLKRFQILTSAPMENTAVILMLCVTTPGDPITARAKMDFMEME